MMSKTDFAESGNILKAIKGRVTGTTIKKADFAVAYWGKGTIELIGLDTSPAEIRILCDLRSGVCDPDTMSDLLKRKNTNIKTRDHLHAKVYLSARAAIVGSANASKRGLETLSDLEAAMVVNDALLISTIQQWFDNLWDDASSEVIDQTAVDGIRPLWRLKQIFDAPTLFAALNQLGGTQVFDRFQFVIFYEPDDTQSDKLHSQFWTLVSDAYSQPDQKKYQSGGWPIYVDDSNWQIRRGDFVINYWFYANTNKIELGGVWRAKDIKVIKGRRIILGDLIDKTIGILGFKFPKKEQIELANRMKKHVDTGANRRVISIDPKDLAAK